jgi:hypothetical protein
MALALAGFAACANPARAEKNWAAPGQRIEAQALVDAIMKQRPELLSVTLHGVPPGEKDVYTMFAGSYPDRIGNKDDPDDIDVQAKGITIVDPRWNRQEAQRKFVVLTPLRDRAHNNIGLVVYAFKSSMTFPDDERRFYLRALELRDDLAEHIASYDALFKPTK